jgi:transketolase
MLAMRDAFFLKIFEKAKQNPDIVVLTSDFSAPSFDRFRIELPGQFINTGISEQNTILVAAGLALSGKTVFVTSIAPFITMRCFEQTRLFAADMNLNIKIIAVGAGFSYNTAGPTHHSVEDIAIMRTLPNMKIFLPCCNSQVETFAENCVEEPGPAYVRLDRMILDEQYNGSFVQIKNAGFSILRKIVPITIVTTGYMVKTTLEAVDALGAKSIPIGVIDAYRLPFDEKAFAGILTGVKRLIILEEHVKQGGLGSYICETLADNDVQLLVKRFGFDFLKGFHHHYGSRDEMLETCGLSVKQLVTSVEDSLCGKQ